MIRICFFSFFTFTMPILRWIREQIPNQFDIIKTTSTMENSETTKVGIQDATGCSSMDQDL